MELIKLVTRRSAFSESIYIILNLAYAALLFVLVLIFDPPWLAYLVVILSKWRVLAVRPRFWMANIQANVVDTLVGMSFVTLLWLTSGLVILQILLLGLFAAWLLFVKPRSSRRWMIIQAAVGQFVGLTALFSLSYEVFSSVVVLVAWVIGYSVARHTLSVYSDESEWTLLSLIWGFIVAELAWLAQHWTIAYTIVGDFKIPQIAITASLLGFLSIKTYELLRSEEKHLMRELRWPLIFVGVLIATMLLRFNGLDMTQL